MNLQNDPEINSETSNQTKEQERTQYLEQNLPQNKLRWMIQISCHPPHSQQQQMSPLLPEAAEREYLQDM